MEFYFDNKLQWYCEEWIAGPLSMCACVGESHCNEHDSDGYSYNGDMEFIHAQFMASK